MSKGRYQRHTQEECNRVAKLRKQGLTYAVISERTGYTTQSLREMLARAR